MIMNVSFAIMSATRDVRRMELEEPAGLQRAPESRLRWDRAPLDWSVWPIGYVRGYAGGHRVQGNAARRGNVTGGGGIIRHEDITRHEDIQARGITRHEDIARHGGIAGHESITRHGDITGNGTSRGTWHRAAQQGSVA
jgi:hypothetical protein